MIMICQIIAVSLKFCNATVNVLPPVTVHGEVGFTQEKCRKNIGACMWEYDGFSSEFTVIRLALWIFVGKPYSNVDFPMI